MSAQTRMIGLKRYIRPGLVVSAIAHVGILIVGPLFVGANVLQPPPPPPDAMVVEIVTQEDLPRFTGTPSIRRSSGSETSSPSTGANAVSQTPPPKSHEQPQRPTPPDPQQHPGPSEAQNQSSEPQPTDPRPQPEETPDQPNIAEMVAQYVAAGGPLGGGFAAPPVDTTQAGYDFTAPFREHVSACSRLPSELAIDDKVTVKIRVSFNRDGTLAAAPRLLGPPPSSKQQALFERAVNALEKCQPYGMLPPERYKQWKTLVLDIYPLSFFR